MKYVDKNWVLDFLYPRRCPICGEIQNYGDVQICKSCMSGLKRVEPPFCMRCGKTVWSDEQEYCEDCKRFPKYYEKGYPVFIYQEPLKKALYDFKYHNQREYALFFAKCMYYRFHEEWEKLSFDGIVPVPLHKNKLRRRGYNQAALLAKQLSKQLAVPFYTDYLVRKEDTGPQKELNDRQRMKNLKKAFKIGKNKIKLKRILLVDDIYTSGATIASCTEVLQSAGVEQVWYASVAIGQGYSG